MGAISNHDAAAGRRDIPAKTGNTGGARRPRSGREHGGRAVRKIARAQVAQVPETGEEHDMSVPQRSRLADELSRRLAAAIRGAQLYAPGHPLVTRSARALIDTLTLVHQSTASVAIGIVGEELVVGEVPVPRAAETMSELMRRLQQLGIERIVIDKGVQEAEIEQLVAVVASGEGGDSTAALANLPHIRVGRLELEEQVSTSSGDIATFRRLYDDAVKVAEDLWDSASTEGAPDADAAR